MKKLLCSLTIAGCMFGSLYAGPMQKNSNMNQTMKEMQNNMMMNQDMIDHHQNMMHDMMNGPMSSEMKKKCQAMMKQNQNMKRLNQEMMEKNKNMMKMNHEIMMQSNQ